MVSYFSVSAIVKTIGLDTRVTVMTRADSVHCLVVAATWDRVDAIARLESFRAV